MKYLNTLLLLFSFSSCIEFKTEDNVRAFSDENGVIAYYEIKISGTVNLGAANYHGANGFTAASNTSLPPFNPGPNPMLFPMSVCLNYLDYEIENTDSNDGVSVGIERAAPLIDFIDIILSSRSGGTEIPGGSILNSEPVYIYVRNDSGPSPYNYSMTVRIGIGTDC